MHVSGMIARIDSDVEPGQLELAIEKLREPLGLRLGALLRPRRNFEEGIDLDEMT